MSSQLKNRVALVTGAGAGMGRAHAELLAERRAHVVVQDIRPERAEAVAAGIVEAGGAAEAMDGDVSKVTAFGLCVGDAEKRLGRIDILVNNAGISGLQTPFEDIDEAVYDRMMAVHAKAAFFAARAVVPGMKSRRYGKIINVSSMFAMKGSPNAPHYTMAKSALLGLTKALALELAPWGICVNAVAPGLLRTEMTIESIQDDRVFEERAGRVPMGRLAEPRDVALTVAFLASPDSDYMTGQTLSPSGGDAIVGI